MKLPTILLTGGRAFVTLDLVREFGKQGYRVIIAESIPWHLCRFSRHVAKNYLVPRPKQEPKQYIEALLTIIRQEQVELVIPTCEEIFFVAQGYEQLRAACQVLIVTWEQLRRLHSKWEFIQCALQHNLSVPETRLLSSHEEMKHILKNSERPLVLKPVFSRFGTRVIFTNDQSAIKQIGQIVINENCPWVAQEQLVGQAFCSYSVALRGQLLAHCVYPVRHTANRGACIYFEPVEHKAIDAWVTQFVQREQFSGQIAFDFITATEGKVCAIECNPRATSGIHLFHGGTKLSKVLLHPLTRTQGATTPEQISRPEPTQRAMIAVAMLVYGRPTMGSLADWWKWIKAYCNTRDVVFDRSDILPFLSQPFLLWYNWKKSRKARLSLLEFSTADIEWNGGEAIMGNEEIGSL